MVPGSDLFLHCHLDPTYTNVTLCFLGCGWCAQSSMSLACSLESELCLHRTKTSPSIYTQLCRLLVKAYPPCDVPITFQFSEVPLFDCLSKKTWSLLTSLWAHFLWLQPYLDWRKTAVKERYSQLPHWFGGLSRPGFLHQSVSYHTSDSCSMVGETGQGVLPQSCLEPVPFRSVEH